MGLDQGSSKKSEWRRQFFVASAFVFAVGVVYFTRDPADDALVLAMAKAMLLVVAAWLIGLAAALLSTHFVGGRRRRSEKLAP